MKRISLEGFKQIVEDASVNTDYRPVYGNGFALTKGAITGMKIFMSQTDPMRLDDMRIVYVKEGEAEVTINLMARHIKRGMLALLSCNTIIQVHRYSDDFDIEGFIVTNEMLEVFMHGKVPMLFEQTMTDVQLLPTKEEIMTFDVMLDSLERVSALTSNSDMVYGDIICAIIHYYDYLYKKYSVDKQNRKSRERDIFDRFIRQVNSSKGIERQLAYYADKLCISERYMGTVVRQVSDVTAKEWIDRAAIANIKVMLRHSDRQISQIADDMHFANDSFFCKYFKRLTGMTPNEYRES